MTEQTKEVEEGKFFAVIAYISFLCIITLVLKRENKFALYHGKQGLVLFVCEVASFILSIIPFVGMLVWRLGVWVFLLVSLWGIIIALSGTTQKIPVFSDIAEKISI